jgi:glutamate/tyrosine decarboxylase-like PLP-dependent enzyme
MHEKEILANEKSLDPKDWESLRQLGHQMVDDMLHYLKTQRQRPVWQKPPERVKKKLLQPLPGAGETPENIYREFLENMLPYQMGNVHPRFWGWVIGTGTPLTMLAEMLAAGTNPNCGGGDHVANYVEAQVLDWLKEMLRYPKDASGLLVSGGSMANFLGLAVARNTQTGSMIREKGVVSAPGKLLVYCSTETHSSVDKSIELLGLGHEALRKIPVDDNFKIKISELEKSIAQDKAAGHQPLCIIGNAGTVNTGAIDDLEAIANLCMRENLWFHVDGAFGALANLLPEYQKALAGMSRADSLAFDLHKWMYIAYEAGCILVKDAERHKQAFEYVPDYLMRHDRGLPAGPYYFSNLGIELSRGFKSLKVWFSLKEHGTAKYQKLIRQNLAQAKYLAGLIEKHSELELLAPIPLNIVCYRFVSRKVDAAKLNELNKEILMELHEQGIAVPSFTLLHGKYAIRVAITNHRSRKEDFDLLVKETIRIGEEKSKIIFDKMI